MLYTPIITTEIFIKRVKEKYGDQFTFEKTNYQTSRKKVILTCKDHGDFEIAPSNILRNPNGCKLCGFEKRKLGLNEFIKRANNIHNNFYDYTKSVYKDTSTKLIICCPKHGEFEQTPGNHLSGHGCWYCMRENLVKTLTYSFDEWLYMAKKQHGDKFDYSKVDYINLNTPVKIICKEHGDFKQSPNTHLISDYACPKCLYTHRSEILTMSQDDFIKRCKLIHYNFYDYSKTVYKSGKDFIIIKCPKHGEFKQRAGIHLNGHACKKCQLSKYEKMIMNYLDKNNIQNIPGFRFLDCRNKFPLPFDFYLPKHNICIEFDGEHHFKEIDFSNGKLTKEELSNRLKLNIINDNIKNEYCKNNRIKLIRISYYESDQIIEILEKEIK